jgi:hypothetical protein
VRGASFDKKEFKRNVAGSGAYAPSSTVAIHAVAIDVIPLPRGLKLAIVNGSLITY